MPYFVDQFHRVSVSGWLIHLFWGPNKKSQYVLILESLVVGVEHELCFSIS